MYYEASFPSLATTICLSIAPGDKTMHDGRDYGAFIIYMMSSNVTLPAFCNSSPSTV